MTQELERLTARRAELAAVVEKPTRREEAAQELARIEQELSAAQHAAEIVEATKRLVGIQRAVGSLETELEADGQAVTRAVAAAAEVIQRANARFAKLGALHDEARHLCLDYSIPMPKLRALTPPGTRGISTTLPGLEARQPRRTPSPKQVAAAEARGRAEQAFREASMRTALSGLERSGWLRTAAQIKNLQRNVPAQSI